MISIDIKTLTMATIKNTLTSLLLLSFTFFQGSVIYGQTFIDSTAVTCNVGDGIPATLTLASIPPAASDAVLTFYYKGDLDGSTNEYYNLYDENNVLIGRSNPTTQCGATYASRTFNIPQATVATWAADGKTEFKADPQVGINNSTCPGSNCVFVSLAYDGISGPNDAGVIAIDSPSNFCAGSHKVMATILNAGTNIINSVTVNWTFDGAVQTPFNFSGTLDTINGTGSNRAKVTLGTRNFVMNQSHDIVVWTSNPNGVQDTFNTNDTAKKTVKPAIAGNLTIGGTNPDYNTFKDAVDDINKVGLCGPVVFNVRNGTYTEQLVITSILGASAVNTVTFQSENRDSSLVKLTFTPTSSLARYVLKLDGAAYVTFRDMTISNPSTSYGVAVELGSGANNNTFSHCLLEGPSRNTTSTFLATVYNPTGIESYNTFENNLVRGGSYGFYFYGQSTISKEKGNVIRNNRIESYYMGIYSYYQEDVTLENNNIESNTFAKYTGFRGIYAYYNSGKIMIARNRINAVDGQYGIYAYNMQGDTNNTATIANNMIHVGGAGTAYGIYIAGSSQYTNVVYNSVNVTTTNVTSGRAIYAASFNHVYLFNNIFSNSGGGYAAYYQSLPDSIDFNNYFSSGPTLAYYLGDRQTLSDFQSATSQDANSFAEDPIFTDPVDLQPGVTMNNRATPIAGITTDIDLKLRSNTTPDLGCIEFVPPPIDLAVIDITAPVSDCDLTDIENISVLIRNMGANDLPVGTALTMKYQMNIGAIVSENTTLPSNLASLDSFTYTFSNPIDLSNKGEYLIEATADMNGDGNPNNNSFKKIITNTGVSNIPYVERFETWTPETMNPSCQYFDGPAMRGWVQDNADNGDWNLNSGYSGSTSTGPTRDFNPGTSTGKYMYVNSNYPCSNGKMTYNLILPCIDLTQISNPGLNFAYHMYDQYNSTMGSFAIDIITDVVTINNAFLKTGNQGTDWHTAVLKLNSYASFGVVSIRFRAETNGSRSFMGLDDVRVGTLPNVDFGINSITDCGSVTLDAGIDNAKYFWSTGDTSKVITMIAGPVTSIQKVYLRVEKNGMYNSDSIEVILDPGPYVDLGGEQVFCGADSVYLDAGNPGMLFKWDNGVLTQRRLVTQSGTYWVEVRNFFGCVKRDTVEVSLDDTAKADFTIVRNSSATVQFDANNSVGVHYFWDFGDGVTSNVKNPTHYFVNGGPYTVTLIVSNGCGADTLIQNIIVGAVGINNIEFLEQFSIYPNPSNGVFNLEWTVSKVSDWTVSIFDVEGREVYSEKVNGVNASVNRQIDLKGISKGIYTVKLHTEEGIATMRLVIQ
jgi:parallel beta-helix repeat protein